MILTIWRTPLAYGWASKKGPSGHMEFHHTFQLCCIIANDLLNPVKLYLYYLMHNSMNNILQLLKANTVHRTQNIKQCIIRCILRQPGPFCWPDHIYVRYKLCKFLLYYMYINYIATVY